MFATPIQAVYTRTITAPIAGARVTGKQAGIRYTALVAEDDGGGSVVVPGPTSSSFAPADFGSTVFIARAKRDIGLSFVSVLATDREHRGDERPQPGRRARLPVAAVGERPGLGAVALQRHQDARSSRSRRRVDRADADRARRRRAVVAQPEASRLVRAVPGRQRRLPRRHGLRAAGGLPGVGRPDRMDGQAEERAVESAHLLQRGPADRHDRQADQPQPAARLRHGFEAEWLHAVPHERRPDPDARRGADRAAAVRLHRAVQPVAVPRADRERRHARAGNRFRQLAARAADRRST